MTQEENKIRLMRYGLGIVTTFSGFFGFWCLDKILANESSYGEFLLMVITLFIGTFSLVAIIGGAILIGRCEEFVKNGEWKNE